jgi:molecular chaperone Hsp31 and glyoxalase 3
LRTSSTKYQGDKSRFGGIFTEQKNLEMKNGKFFSGNHRNTVPMLHLKMQVDFEIATYW